MATKKTSKPGKTKKKSGKVTKKKAPISPPKKHAGGRPSRYEKRFVDETMKLSVIGVGEEQIAWFLGVHPVTFRRWKKRHEELCTAIKKGQADRNVRLHTAMFNSAITHRNIAMQIFLAKNWLGMSDRQDINFPDLSDADESIIKFEIIHTNSKRTPASGEDTQTPARSSKPPKPPEGKPRLTVPAAAVEKKLPKRKNPQKRVNLM